MASLANFRLAGCEHSKLTDERMSRSEVSDKWSISHLCVILTAEAAALRNSLLRFFVPDGFS